MGGKHEGPHRQAGKGSRCPQAEVTLPLSNTPPGRGPRMPCLCDKEGPPWELSLRTAAYTCSQSEREPRAHMERRGLAPLLALVQTPHVISVLTFYDISFLVFLSLE